MRLAHHPLIQFSASNSVEVCFLSIIYICYAIQELINTELINTEILSFVDRNIAIGVFVLHFLCVTLQVRFLLSPFHELFQSLFPVVSIAVGIYFNRLQEWSTGTKLFCI